MPPEPIPPAPPSYAAPRRPGTAPASPGGAASPGGTAASPRDGARLLSTGQVFAPSCLERPLTAGQREWRNRERARIRHAQALAKAASRRLQRAIARTVHQYEGREVTTPFGWGILLDARPEKETCLVELAFGVGYLKRTDVKLADGDADEEMWPFLSVELGDPDATPPDADANDEPAIASTGGDAQQPATAAAAATRKAAQAKEAAALLDPRTIRACQPNLKVKSAWEATQARAKARAARSRGTSRRRGRQPPPVGPPPGFAAWHRRPPKSAAARAEQVHIHHGRVTMVTGAGCGRAPALQPSFEEVLAARRENRGGAVSPAHVRGGSVLQAKMAAEDVNPHAHMVAHTHKRGHLF